MKEIAKWLIKKYGKENCRRIYNDPRDVNYSWFQIVFEGLNWEEL